MKKCAILGAGGYGKVVAEIAELNGYHNIAFFDDRWPALTCVEHWAITGNTGTLLTNVSEYDLVIVAIGNNDTRLIKQRELSKAGACLAAIIHPKAVVSRYARIGLGTVVMANAVINPFSVVGAACIVNTGATVEHDCRIEDGVHISPGANLAGAVEVGETSWVGMGSTVKQQIKVGSNVVIGAGSVVVENIEYNQVVVGIPAKPCIIKE